ncbi:hypothetical protein NG653_11770 [Robiginitalea sp. 2V75]|uniref:Uncharacterized protein n=1 Tax=Robiginitalea marina TaxID=2954105 RepID=A0ABT1AZX4_9FLAO|nr:hypothetical protein [Robiginitalea marina]
MKKESNLSKKVASVVATSLAVLGSVGFASNHNEIDQPKSEEVISNKQSKPQLILSTSETNNYSLESTQASHASHSSHSSHGSHASHASHASSSI